MHDQPSGLYTIGLTKCLETRLDNLREMGYEVRLLSFARTDDTKWLESIAHKCFAEQRTRTNTEWFALEPYHVENFWDIVSIAADERGCGILLVEDAK